MELKQTTELNWIDMYVSYQTLQQKTLGAVVIRNGSAYLMKLKTAQVQHRLMKKFISGELN